MVSDSAAYLKNQKVTYLMWVCEAFTISRAYLVFVKSFFEILFLVSLYFLRMFKSLKEILTLRASSKVSRFKKSSGFLTSLLSLIRWSISLRYPKIPSNLVLSLPCIAFLACFNKKFVLYWAITVLSPSKVTYGEKSSISLGIPDQAEYPAPPMHYLICKRPSYTSWVKTDFIPDV